jgi:hypothetical protein
MSPSSEANSYPTNQEILYTLRDSKVYCHDRKSPLTYLLTYLLTYGAEPFLRSHQLCSHSRTSQHFMEPEVSSPCSQEPSSGPYPERARYWSLSCARWIQSTLYKFIFLRPILIFALYLRLGPPGGPSIHASLPKLLWKSLHFHCHITQIRSIDIQVLFSTRKAIKAPFRYFHDNSGNKICLMITKKKKHVCNSSIRRTSGFSV